MKIVFLDCSYVNPGDIPWDAIERNGQLEFYNTSTPSEGAERMKDADVVIVDKFVIGRNLIEKSPKLKLIAVAATGYNNIDLEAAKENGISVVNVPAYSTDSVAQHTFALILALTNQVAGLDQMVGKGEWVPARKSVYNALPLTLLAGKSIGIVGFGNIGKKVAQIAEAFGMIVNIYSKNKEAAIGSDIVTLHCPLNGDTDSMVNAEFISKMKDGAFLINTARGGLVDESALLDGIKSGKLGGAGLDVITEEPTDKDPIFHLPNVLITPHTAFAPVEIRSKIVSITGNNIEAFAKGENLNRIV